MSIVELVRTEEDGYVNGDPMESLMAVRLVSSSVAEQFLKEMGHDPLVVDENYVASFAAIPGGNALEMERDAKGHFEPKTLCIDGLAVCVLDKDGEEMRLRVGLYPNTTSAQYDTTPRALGACVAKFASILPWKKPDTEGLQTGLKIVADHDTVRHIPAAPKK